MIERPSARRLTNRAMVFSSYSNTSYLPLDSEQGVSFYKNENLLFQSAVSAVSPPSTLVCRRNTAAAAAMMTATTGSSPFGSQPLHHGNACDDFQPVAHLSSNGYYGYVPASSIPKVMSTEGTPPAAAVATTNGNGVGVPLDCHPVAGTVVDSNSSSMMDCGGDIGTVGSYHYHQQEQRKRKEHYSEDVEVSCKRRKTSWLQPNDAGFTPTPVWPQPAVVQHMECHDQPMDTFPAQHFNGSPVTMNGGTTAFNGFQLQHHHPQQQALITSPPMPQTVQQQPKSKYPETSRCMMSHMI